MYSQSPCGNDQATAKVIVSTKSVADSEGCGLARQLAVTVAANMKSGWTAVEMFDQFDGLNSLSKGPINIINDVYSFKESEDVAET